jgi:MFS transporter, OFA family, oxalate/formate antiporter
LTHGVPHPQHDAGPPGPQRMGYGWVIVVTGYLVGLLTSGMHSYTRGIFLVPMAETLESSRLELSLGFTIAGLVAAGSAPLAGWMLDRWPLRRLMTAMALWTVAGYLALASIDTRFGLFVVMGLFFGLATFHLGGPAPAKLVVDWFPVRRGFALSLIAMGASTAGVLTPPLATALIERFDWRWTFVIYGAITLLLVVPLILATVRNAPAPRPGVPDAAGPEPGDGDTQPKAAVTPARAARAAKPSDRAYLRSRNFWSMVIMFGVMGCVFSGVSLHFFAHMTDLGIAPLRASFILSVMAALAFASKPVFGALVDRLDARVSVGLSLICQFAGVGLLLLAHAEWQFLVAAVTFGFGYGGMVPLRNALTAIGFRIAAFGEISGAMRTAMAPLTMGGMPLAGWIFDVSGSYAAAFWTFLALYVAALAALGLWRLERP